MLFGYIPYCDFPPFSTMRIGRVPPRVRVRPRALARGPAPAAVSGTGHGTEGLAAHGPRVLAWASGAGVCSGLEVYNVQSVQRFMQGERRHGGV